MREQQELQRMRQQQELQMMQFYPQPDTRDLKNSMSFILSLYLRSSASSLSTFSARSLRTSNSSLYVLAALASWQSSRFSVFSLLDTACTFSNSSRVSESCSVFSSTCCLSLRSLA